MSISLYNIELALLQLAELREVAEEDGDSKAVAIIDQQIGEYLDREPAKIDSCCAIARKMEADAEACKEEAERLLSRSKMINIRLAVWKESWLRAMKLRDINELKTATNTMRRQLNGGKQALEITDEQIVPLEYVEYQIKVPGHLLNRLMEAVLPDKEMADSLRVQLNPVFPNKEAIREALSRRVPCPECKGEGSVFSTPPPDSLMETCPRCKGVGTVTETVPGARIMPRKERLRIL